MWAGAWACVCVCDLLCLRTLACWKRLLTSVIHGMCGRGGHPTGECGGPMKRPPKLANVTWDAK